MQRYSLGMPWACGKITFDTTWLLERKYRCRWCSHNFDSRWNMVESKRKSPSNGPLHHGDPSTASPSRPQDVRVPQAPSLVEALCSSCSAPWLCFAPCFQLFSTLKSQVWFIPLVPLRHGLKSASPRHVFTFFLPKNEHVNGMKSIEIR